MMRIDLTTTGADQLEGLARTLRAMPDAMARAGTVAVNAVARTVIADAASDLTQRYNLPAAYIKDQFSIALASNGGQLAVVGVRRRPMRLARFDANQLTVAAPRAKGDVLRRIGKGRKQAGVSVKVMRSGGRDPIRSAFLLPLRAGKVDGGNGFGVFERIGPGKSGIKQLYGPSPYQVFSGWVKRNQPDISARLLQQFQQALQREIRR